MAGAALFYQNFELLFFPAYKVAIILVLFNWNLLVTNFEGKEGG